MTHPVVVCGLLAAGLDWLEGLLPVLFVGFWIVSQVFAALRRGQAGGAPRPPRVEQARPPALPRGPEGDAADLRGELERQIAEFLRDSPGEQRRSPKRAAAAAQPARQPRDSTSAGSDHGTPKNRRREAPAAARPQPAAAGQRVAPPGRLAEAAPRDESVARHVHEAFAHELAHLRGDLATAAPQPAAEPPPATPAQELVSLLRHPATVRQAILLSAVLDRPVERW